MVLRVDVVYDLPADGPYGGPTLDAIAHAGRHLGADVTVDVVSTSRVSDAYLSALDHAVVIGPGTPYAVPDAAEAVIATARERGLPLVGT